MNQTACRMIAPSRIALRQSCARLGYEYRKAKAEAPRSLKRKDLAVALQCMGLALKPIAGLPPAENLERGPAGAATLASMLADLARPGRRCPLLDEEMPDLGSEYDPIEVWMANLEADQQDQAARADHHWQGYYTGSFGGSVCDDCSLHDAYSYGLSDDEATAECMATEERARQRKEHHAAMVIQRRARVFIEQKQYENAVATKAALRESGVTSIPSEVKVLEDEAWSISGIVANFDPWEPWLPGCRGSATTGELEALSKALCGLSRSHPDLRGWGWLHGDHSQENGDRALRNGLQELAIRTAICSPDQHFCDMPPNELWLLQRELHYLLCNPGCEKFTNDLERLKQYGIQTRGSDNKFHDHKAIAFECEAQGRGHYGVIQEPCGIGTNGWCQLVANMDKYFATNGPWRERRRHERSAKTCSHEDLESLIRERLEKTREGEVQVMSV